MGPGRLRLRLLRGAFARMAGEPIEAEAADAALEAARLLRGQAAAARARRVRKLMEPPGPPERTLTRQAMEQMRFLGREWPVHRLARGFQVQPEVVRRVLRSRFSPSPERRRKQDARALASSLPRPGTDEAAPGLQPASPAGSPARLPATRAWPRRAPAAVQAAPAECRRAGGGGGAPCEEQSRGEASGQPPGGVVRRGREVFDREGRLLYRIPHEVLGAGGGSSSEETR